MLIAIMALNIFISGEVSGQESQSRRRVYL